MKSRSLLAIDVGGGTQDILLHEEGKDPENCFKLVLPSPTVIVAEKIRRAAAQGQGVHLTGEIMGGGPCVRALRDHLEMGLGVSAEEEAAKTIKDDLGEVANLGVVLTSTPPPGSAIISMGDLDLDALRAGLAPFCVSLPQEVAVAVQDHGHSPHGSNRLFRFHHWQDFLASGGDIRSLAYRKPPAYLTRMAAVKRRSPEALLMDTCGAALFGVLSDETVAPYRREGMVVVNVGNQHTFAVLLKGWQVFGLFEHHTGKMTSEKLEDYIERLRRGELTHQEVFADGGHGCSIPEKPGPGSFPFVAVTGPKRRLAADRGYYFAAPYGDMMLTGCFGLVLAWRLCNPQAN